MSERRAFETKDSDVEIISHPDGSLTITADAEYGDSYQGFGTTSKTYTMDADEVARFVKFLAVNNPKK